MSGGGSLTPSLEWSPDKTDFGALAEVSAGGEGSLGIGGEVKVSIGYSEGKFKMAASAMLVFGPGAKGSFELSFGVDEGFELLAHLFFSVDYHWIEEVAKEAFEAFVNLAFSRFLPKELQKTIGALGGMGEFSQKVLSYVRKNIAEIKKTIRTNVQNTENLRKSPPETLGSHVLKTLMTTET